MVAVRLPPDLVEQIEEVAAERGMTITGVYEEALREHLQWVCDNCGQTLPSGRKRGRREQG